MKKRKPRLSFEEISLFSRQLSLVIESDISLQEGLGLIGIKDQNKTLIAITRQMVIDLNQGKSFLSSVSQFREEFGSFFISMVEIGEKSGNMAYVMTQVADSFDKQHETRQKIRAAMTYPVILSLLMLGVVVALIAYVMPMFNEILSSMGGTIPPFTRAILDISLFLSDNILWLLGIVLILVLVPLVIRTTVWGKKFFSRIGFSVPVQKDILASGLASRFARNLGLLNRSGINMIISLEMIKTIMGNPYLEDKIQQAAELLKKGESFDKAIASLELFPPILIKLMAIAYGTGHIDKTLEKAAMVMESELDSRLEKLTTVIEPLLIIILSVFVGIILLSVILPVAGIINTLG